jgi:hypothetical protein
MGIYFILWIGLCGLILLSDFYKLISLKIEKKINQITHEIFYTL